MKKTLRVTVEMDFEQEDFIESFENKEILETLNKELYEYISKDFGEDIKYVKDLRTFIDTYDEKTIRYCENSGELIVK